MEVNETTTVRKTQEKKHQAVTKIKRADGTLIDSYSYDANGNMLSGAGRTFTYDYDNRPTSIIYNSMALISVYDASGNRVKKVTPTSTTVYIGDLYECTSGQCTKYIFAGTQRVAKIDSAGTNYHHTDHLGSSSIITNSSGAKVEDIYYYPYGEIKTDSGTLNVRHKFTDQEWDAETGLYYYGARYYDPRLARFISADTIVPEPFYPQSLNRYAYTINNPVILRELDGNCFVFVTVGGQQVPYVAYRSGSYTFHTTTGAIGTAQGNATGSNALGRVGWSGSFTYQATPPPHLNVNTNLTFSYLGYVTSGALGNVSGGGSGSGGGQGSTSPYSLSLGNYADRLLSSDKVASYIYGETSGIRPGESTPEDLAQARENVGNVVINRIKNGMDPGHDKLPNPNNPVQMQQWNQCWDAAYKALHNPDPTKGALNFNIREATQLNPTTRPHSVWGLPVYMFFGPFYNVGGGDVRKGDVYINVYK